MQEQKICRKCNNTFLNPIPAVIVTTNGNTYPIFKYGSDIKFCECISEDEKA